MKNGVIIIGISGPSASGKTLLANTIVREIGSDQMTIISEDSYYKDIRDMPHPEHVQNNWDHPDAFDHDLLYQHLLSLQQGKSIEIPVYDFARDERTLKTITLRPHRIIVLEGILLFVEPKLSELMDIRIFIDTPLDICLIRRLTRDILERERSLTSVLDQYEATVRPMYFQFVEPSKRHADIIVPRGGENRIAIDMIKAKVREILDIHTLLKIG